MGSIFVSYHDVFDQGIVSTWSTKVWKYSDKKEKQFYI